MQYFKTPYKLLLIFIAFILTFAAHAQYHGNWINQNQHFYKIGVAKTGIVKVTLNDLIEAGVPVSSFNAENLQVFYRGKEIPIYVKKTSGALNYIEFFAKRNTGWFDEGLYSTPSNQTNPYYSQITDTSAYFFTWNNSNNNKRYSLSDFNNQNAQDINYGIAESLVQYTSELYMGDEFPEYDNSKGWFDRHSITLGASRTKVLSLPGLYNNADDVLIKTAVISHGDASTIGGDNHHLQIQLPGNNSFDTVFSGKTAVRKEFQIPGSLMSAENSIVYSSIDDLNVAADNMAVSYIHAVYPATFSMADKESMAWQVEKKNVYQRFTIEGLSEQETPLICDTANYIFPTPVFNGDNWQFTLPPSVKNHYIIIQKEPFTAGYIEHTNVEMNEPTETEYLIITHRSLSNSAAQYANYRNAEIIFTDVLYNHFSRGIKKHPLAIKNYLNYYYNEIGSLPAYLLLLGKAVSINGSRNNSNIYFRNLVPTYGYPPSDNFLVCNITNSNSYSPEIAVSRIAAVTNEQASQYLNKVQDFESEPPADWMKQIIHFGGGSNQAEQSTFANYLSNYERVIEDTLMGANVSTFLKNSSDPIQITSSDSIQSLINNGASMLTFFGHGHTGGFDQDIDEPSAYNNESRYPLILANSCYSGNIHTGGTQSASESWVLIPNKGAIAFLASVFQGYPGLLNNFSDKFYKNLAYNNYGQGMGKVVQHTVIAHLEQAETLLDKGTALNFTLHGDPAIVLNQFQKPDIALKNNMVQVKPKEVTTALDSFLITFTATNIGKAITGEVSYQVEHRLPDGTDSLYFLSDQDLYYQDTISFWLPVDRQNGPGLNTIRIMADYLGNYDELSEINNSVEFGVNIKSADLFPVYPYQYAVNRKDTIILRACTGDPFVDQVYAKIEIDTTPDFTSTFKKTFEQNIEGGIIEWNTGIKSIGNQAYYWRAGTRDNENDYNYNYRSFTHQASGEGWVQSTIDQIAENELQFITMNNNNFEFFNAPKNLVCQNVGANGITDYHDIYYKINNATTSASCGTGKAMIIAVFDSLNFQTWAANHGDYGQKNYPQCFSASYPHAQFVFSTNESSLDDMTSFIENIIPNGYYILAYSFKSGNFETWKNRHFETFENLGATQIRGVPNQYPYILLAQKGDPNHAQEIIGQNESDEILLDVNLKDNFDYGHIATPWIGPANRWDSLSWKFDPSVTEPEDSVSIEIRSKNAALKNEHVLFDNLSLSDFPVDLTNVDATVHPYLKVRFFVRDRINKTPAYPSEIKMNYQPKGDIAISKQDYFNFPDDSLQEGNMLDFGLAFRNTSDFVTDSTTIEYYITDVNNQKISAQESTLKSLNESEFENDTIQFSTTGLNGFHTLWVEYNQQSASDFYSFNNLGSIPFYVYGDNSPPLLDVTFDGRHILNGEIVNANPTIKITLQDENPYLSLNDTSSFAIYLTPPGETEHKIYLAPNIENGTMLWQPADSSKKASITYRPDLNIDGIYQLRIQAKDASDNSSGTEDYQIQFEVVNESTITNIFNYPNPFSSHTQFVFTLTGSRVPDNMSIDIYTISGKKVKHISMNELGPISIGKNITDYAWNGRDDFGDRLANGVYLYKVNVKIDGEKLKLRKTEADGFFKKGWGKMFLMR